MYRTLLATCGSAELQMFLPIEYTYYCISFSLSHTLQATCGTLPCNENKHLTHVTIFGQARCGTIKFLPSLPVPLAATFVFLAEKVIAHRTMGERPPPHGRSPTAPWARAHRTVGDENVRGEDGFGGAMFSDACLWVCLGFLFSCSVPHGLRCCRIIWPLCAPNRGCVLTICVIFGVKLTNFGYFLSGKENIFYLCRVE